VPQGGITSAASPTPRPGQPATFSDPFTYCAALGTIDAPDSRYTGPAVPEAVAQGLKKAFGAPADAPLEPFLHDTFWRCMNGQVYACTVGANLPCQERADVSRRPTQGMTTFCQNNPPCRGDSGFRHRARHGVCVGMHERCARSRTAIRAAGRPGLSVGHLVRHQPQLIVRQGAVQAGWLRSPASRRLVHLRTQGRGRGHWRAGRARRAAAAPSASR
jgi:hypothetical protein